ncbi:pirin family protein [Williamsia sp.]|uniref:pirin family protein n=1 Tax=Williamsia sp. TaxID=1872085 RepID=UPI002F930E48
MADRRQRVSHSEMFPLLDEESGNPFELFQIWLNLPAADKKADPEFTMLWNEDIPVVELTGPDGGTARITIVAGRYGDTEPPATPSNSWASRAGSDVAVWLLDLQPHARVELPAATHTDARRVLYVHGDGAAAIIDGHDVADGHGYVQTSPGTTVVETGDSSAHLLLLQAVPIGEPVAQHGPFVMNTREEIAQAYDDYQRTQFGGWPWDRTDVVHPKSETRFARHTDGRLERPAPAVG